MKVLLADATHALWLGGAITAFGLLCWIAVGPDDAIGLVSFVARFVHVGAAMLWAGLIWLVNFIQLLALKDTGEPEPSAVLVHVMPRAIALFGVASHVVVASGVVLLLTTGYLFDRWVFPSAVYIPSGRAVLMWSGVVGGLVMWWLVHRVMKPCLATMLDEASGAARVAGARDRMLTAARLNLMLAVPVMFAMIGAAHLE